MKRILLFILITLMFSNMKAQPPKNLALASGIALGIGIAAYASVEQMKEGLEQNATEWFLANHPEENLFRLKIRNISGTKLSDLSNVNCMLYTVITFNKSDRKLKEKFVLLSFHSHGWVNDQGVNFEKVTYHLVSKNEWEEFIKLWIETISPVSIDLTKGIPEFQKCNEKKYIENNPNYIRIINNVDGVKSVDFYEQINNITDFQIAQLRMTGKTIELRKIDPYTDLYENTFLIPLSKVDGDTYMRSERKLDFLDSYVVGNEKTICLFKLNDLRLIQLDLDMINYVQEIFD